MSEQYYDVAHQHRPNPVTVHYAGELTKPVEKRGWFGVCEICNKLLKIHYKGTDDEFYELVEECAICGKTFGLNKIAYSESTNFKKPEKVCTKCWNESVEH